MKVYLKFKKTKIIYILMIVALITTVIPAYTLAFSFYVTLPKTITLNGIPDKNGIYKGYYSASVFGSISDKSYVEIMPTTNTKHINTKCSNDTNDYNDKTCTQLDNNLTQFYMGQVNKDDIVATVTQDKTEFTNEDLKSETTSDIPTNTTNGVVSTNKLTAGSWSGNFYFNVSIKEHVEYVYYSSLSLAVNDANNLTTENADISNADDAIAGLNINDNQAQIKLINNTTENENLTFKQNSILNLNKKTLLLNDATMFYEKSFGISNGSVVASTINTNSVISSIEKNNTQNGTLSIGKLELNLINNKDIVTEIPDNIIANKYDCHEYYTKNGTNAIYSTSQNNYIKNSSINVKDQTGSEGMVSAMVFDNPTIESSTNYVNVEMKNVKSDISSNSLYAINVANLNSYTNIMNCEFNAITSSNMIYAGSTSACVLNMSNSTCIIDGGIYTQEDYYLYGSCLLNENSKMEILEWSGSTDVTGSWRAVSTEADQKDASLTIKGGNFKGVFGSIYINTDANISGGTFKNYNYTGNFQIIESCIHDSDIVEIKSGFDNFNYTVVISNVTIDATKESSFPSNEKWARCCVGISNNENNSATNVKILNSTLINGDYAFMNLNDNNLTLNINNNVIFKDKDNNIISENEIKSLINENSANKFYLLQDSKVAAINYGNI